MSTKNLPDPSGGLLLLAYCACKQTVKRQGSIQDLDHVGQWPFGTMQCLLNAAF